MADRCKTEHCGQQTFVIHGQGQSEYCIQCWYAKAPDATRIRGEERFKDAQRHSRGSGKRAEDRYIEKLARERGWS